MDENRKNKLKAKSLYALEKAGVIKLEIPETTNSTT